MPYRFDESNISKDDQYLQDRLRKLGTREVDTSRLESRIEQAIRAESKHSPTILRRKWGSTWLLAASLILTTLALFYFLGPQSSLSRIDVNALAYEHTEFLHGVNDHLHQASSIAEANIILRGFWNDAPIIPSLNNVDVASCCIAHNRHTRVSCLHFKHRGFLLTLLVSTANTLTVPDGDPVDGGVCCTAKHGERVFETYSKTLPDGRFICLIGDAPRAQLLALADEIKG